MDIRVGFGYDVHQLAEGIPFRLGGVTINHSKGAVGHSDADVLIHAICDALFGAAALGDIGKHFPDNDPSLKGIDSIILLEKTTAIIKAEGYTISNIDSTICLEKPKIAPYIEEMRKTLATTIGLESGRVSVKATTEEKLGFTGREEGIAAYAVVLISR